MKNVPKLRFNGFSDEWEEKRLGELFDFKNGLNKEKEFFGKGTPIVNYVDVYRKNELTADNILGLVEVTEKEKENYSVKKGDVFFTRTSETIDEIGYTAVVTEEVENTVFSGFVLRARPKIDNLSDIFCKYCFTTQSARKEIVTKSSYTTRALTSGTLLSGMNVFLPKNILEQEKVANFLTKVDKIIEKQDEKVSNLEQYKKGMMQKIFSQEIRFKKADGGEYPEWEETTIGEVCTINTGNKDTQDREEGGTYPFFVRSQIVERINSYSYDGEAILTAGDGVGVGKVFHYVNCKFDYHQRVYKLSDFNGVTGRFLFEYFSDNFKREVAKYNAKTSVDSVRLEMITKMKMPLPCIEEQTKIANFLSKIDSIVEKEKEKLEELRVWKKGLLQGMFV